MILIVNRLQSWQKTLIAMIYDLIMAFISLSIAFLLRLETLPPEEFTWAKFILTLFFLSVIQYFVLFLSGVYRGIWRYSSTPDLIRIIKACTLAVALSFTGLFLVNRLVGIPRSVFIMDWFIIISFLGGGRLFYRVLRDKFVNSEIKGKVKVVILGAGSAGESLFREIRSNNSLEYHVIGFLDDDLGKRNKYLHGVKVLGTTDKVTHFVEKYEIDLVFIAMPSATRNELNNVLSYCDPISRKVKILPKMEHLIQGQVSLSLLRNLKIEDLLGREEVKLDTSLIERTIGDKIVLVTGAGGSIGSELCNQILKFKPKCLVAFDFSEFNIYGLQRNLEQLNLNIPIIYRIGNIRDKQRLASLFKDFKPQVVFHAAAYKHVPIMEGNPFESVHTNIIGTENLCSVANKYNVEKFVLISTDKAVNPCNIMGATKRIAEMVVQKESRNGSVQFEIVRFGNVLGSSGSVVPLFKQQIEKGGPITVTHPEINRYFMSIPEAARLVLQAGSIGTGGGLFLLDMGKPVKICDLALKMIHLAGLKERDDIEIQFIGLRPGEKLYEELLLDSEKSVPTVHKKIMAAKPRTLPENFQMILDQIKSYQHMEEIPLLRVSLEKIVPGFHSNKHENPIH